MHVVSAVRPSSGQKKKRKKIHIYIYIYRLRSEAKVTFQNFFKGILTLPCIIAFFHCKSSRVVQTVKKKVIIACIVLVNSKHPSKK